MAPSPLSPKDKKLFADLLTQYEHKQLTKGRKTADQILKKHPEHGETMCMKGLILVHLGSREEGIKLAKEGVSKDLSSHICWHVWALIQKGEFNYEEAIKAYLQALRCDKDNFNILRDTAILQTHMRQYEGLIDTRHSLLRLRPSSRQHWVGLAVAYQLGGHLAEAIQVLECIEGFLRNVGSGDVEFSELLLYHIRILEDMGNLQLALEMLESKDRPISNRIVCLEMKVRVISKLKEGQDDDEKKAAWTQRADEAWRELLKHNADCYEYYEGLLANQGIDLANITDENRKRALDILRTYFPVKSDIVPHRSFLDVSSGEDFTEFIKLFLTNGINKGIPSLFADVKPLYKDSFKCQVIEDTAEELRTAYAPKSLPTRNSVEPTAYLWTLYFLAQHHSFLGRYKRALEILDDAIAHTPTLPELYMVRARTLKRAGDPYGAATAMESARSLDGQDRFINTKTGKYFLRAGMPDKADVILSMFTKKDQPVAKDLEEMQALHYFIELGDSYRRAGKLNLALKKYYVIQTIFDVFRKDQYDFHQYSIRKSILNVYTEMLKWEDTMRSHPYYIHATVATAQIWVALHDDPTLGRSFQPSDAALNLASKKEQSKAKKAARKGQTEAAGANSKKGESPRHSLISTLSSLRKRILSAATQSEDKGLEQTREDDDPEGLKLVLDNDPLKRAGEHLAFLTELVPRNLEVCFAAYDVAVRQKKYVQAVKMLIRARSLDPEHPDLHERIAHLRNTVHSLPEPIPAPIGPVVAESIALLLPEEVSLEVFNSQYLQKHSSSPMAVLAHAKVAQILKAPRVDVETILFTVLNQPVELDYTAAFAVLLYLKDMKSSRAEEFRIACNDKFVLCTLFKDAEEITAMQKQLEEPEKPQCDDRESSDNVV